MRSIKAEMVLKVKDCVSSLAVQMESRRSARPEPQAPQDVWRNQQRRLMRNLQQSEREIRSMGPWKPREASREGRERETIPNIARRSS